MLEVKLIGRFEIRNEGKPVTISSRAGQSLFAFLILNAGTSYRREKLAGMFWPDTTEERARAYLRQQLWRIRKLLVASSKDDFFIADDMNVCFNASTEYWLDVASLKRAEPSASADELMEAVALYEGELLPGFYDDWVVLEREHLHSIYEQKMARLIEMLEAEKRWTDILEWAERWISVGQGPEAAYRALMTAHDALGDRAKVAAVYERCVQALRKLDLEPSEETRLLAFKRNPKLDVPVPMTSFIGREKELQEVAGRLSRSRLVTLTGAGGAGKTRLAIQVVAEVLDLFPDGIWFLDLAPLNDPSLVANTLANLLGLRETGNPEVSMLDLLIDYLNSRIALVIFDNCEHLIESCAQLANSLLTSCQKVSILATSREALRISGEVLYRVPSLTIPRLDLKPDMEVLAGSESVRLFIERAVVASPAFTVEAGNILTVAQICQRLDGIPLAIELAAARVTVLSPGQILKRLDDRFDVLKGSLRSSLPRHQTLRATIEWSYDLLAEKEKILFRRLSVFAGSWSLEAAENVCSGTGIETDEILDLLDQLIGKSLVVTETIAGLATTGSSLRYRWLETIRQFANEKLAEPVEAAQLRDRHLNYFVAKVEEIEPFLTTAQQSVYMDYLELELDNIRRAMEWSIVNRQGEQALRLVGALGWLWIVHCHFQEGAQWFRRALQLQDGVAKRINAKALGQAGSLVWMLGLGSEAGALLRESIGLSRELDDGKELSNRLLALGLVELSAGHLTEARTLFEETLTISRLIGHGSAITRALFNLADISSREGDALTAARNLEESLAISRELAEDHLTSMVLLNMGSFATDQKDYPKARACFEEALSISLNLKNNRVTALSLLGFADILYGKSCYSPSANLQGYAIKALKDLGVHVSEVDMLNFSKTATALRSSMGEKSYQKAFQTGSTLSVEKAIEIALQQPI